MTLELVKLLPPTIPPAKNRADVVAWLREIADDIESGRYPRMERVVALIVNDPDETEPPIRIRTLGYERFKYHELIGILAHAQYSTHMDHEDAV
jgi:hypothetical protein